MTQQELEVKVAMLEARIRVLEDTEEIKKLMATFEDYIDSLQRRPELMLGLLTDDAKFMISF